MITQKINELWEHEADEVVKECLTTTYSPDGIPLTYVLYDSDKIIGFCSLLRSDTTTRSDITPWFGNCYIDENYRRRGLMQVMQEIICKEAKKRKYKKIFLWTKDKELYLKSGFQFLEEILVKQNESAYLFYKDLK